MPKKTKEQNLAAVLATVMIIMTIIVGFAAIILKQTNQNTQTALTNATVQAEAQLAEQNAPMAVNAEPLPQLPTFNKPDEMLAVTLEPGVDFLTQLSDPLKKAKASAKYTKNTADIPPEDLEILELDEEKSKAEILEVLDEIQEMGMNTVFVQTNTPLGTVHVVDSIRSLSSFDAMDYILKQAHGKSLFVYALYDISLLPDGRSIKQAQEVTVESIDQSVKPLQDFARNYRVDGILLDGCRNPFTEISYQDYAQNGAGVGLEPYMINETQALVYEAADTVRQVDPNIQVGLAADAVWATSTQETDGLPIEVVTSSLKTDNADTRALAKSGKLDFMVVKNTTATKDPVQPFGTVLEWWDGLSGEVGIPCYMLHAANKAGTWQDGWGGRSELSNQLALTLESPNVQGSVFQSLNNLKKNPNGTTTALKTLIAETATEEQSNTDVVSAGAYKEATVTATVSGQGLSLNPTEAVATSNEDKYRKYVGVYTAPTSVPDSQSLGNVVMKASYKSNTESLTGAKVSVNQKVVIPKRSSEDTSSNKSTGDEGTDNTAIKDGKLVKVVTEQALTFPVGKATIYPDQTCYPLPNGTMDYVVGNKVSVKDGSNYRTYYNLGSGRRVYSTDVKAVTRSSKLEGNSVTGMTVKADSDFTYVILKSDKPVPFLPNYTGSQFTIDFKYTTSTPGDMSLNKNPIFSSASWVGSKLNLAFRTQGGFLGYKAYHENGNIVFRFNNPTSISGAKIVVDPGHGGSDPGAADYFDPPEKTVNWQLSQAIAQELENEGADVLLLKTHDKGMSMDERLVRARNFNAQIFLSVHTNTSENNSSAVGSEAYYFYPFARPLASTVATSISSGLDSNNRGAKYDVFYLTRDPQFVGILSESGFLTNKREYQKMQDPAYQKSIAKNVAASISAFLENAGAENAGIKGSQSVGIESDASSGPSSSNSSSNPDANLKDPNTSDSEQTSGNEQPTVKGDGIVKYVILSTKEMTLSKGQTKELGVTIKGDTSVKKNFASSNTKVATVDENGMITAKSAGKADISIIAGDQKGVCKVTVTKDTYLDEEKGKDEVKGTEADTGVYTPVELVKISPRVVSVGVGESSRLKVNITPENASNKDMTWDVSSGEKYVEITQSGVITGIRPGIASIVVISDDSFVRDEITIEVVG